MRGRSEVRLRDSLKRRMTNRAARVRLRFRYFKAFGDSGRTRGSQNGEGFGVKILTGPDGVLFAFRSGAAVATGGFATGRPDELPGIFAGLFNFLCGNSCGAMENQGNRACSKRQHAARLASRSVRTPRQKVWRMGTDFCGPRNMPNRRNGDFRVSSFSCV